jgi:hypothetical protein
MFASTAQNNVVVLDQSMFASTAKNNVVVIDQKHVCKHSPK